MADIKSRGLQVKQMLDVGANKGDWTRMAKQIFPMLNLHV